MPNNSKQTRGSEAARSWARRRAEQMGAAVKAARGEAGMSAVALAEITAELGYPITRSTIAKIESGNRDGKFDVNEVFVLAAALDISPTDLLIPRKLGAVEVLPDIKLQPKAILEDLVFEPPARALFDRDRLTTLYARQWNTLSFEYIEAASKSDSDEPPESFNPRILAIGDATLRTADQIKQNWKLLLHFGLVEGEIPDAEEFDELEEQFGHLRRFKDAVGNGTR